MSTIQYIGHIELFGNHYLQFKIRNEYYIYKFYCESVFRKTEQILKFSNWKALNQAKKKCHSWWVQTKQWHGWEPEGIKFAVQPDIWKNKPVTRKQLELSLT